MSIMLYPYSKIFTHFYTMHPLAPVVFMPISITKQRTGKPFQRAFGPADGYVSDSSKPK